MSPIQDTDVLALTRPSGDQTGSYKITAGALKAYTGAAANITVENVLTSSSTTNALSAAMGQALKREVDGLTSRKDSYVLKVGDTMTGNLNINSRTEAWSSNVGVKSHAGFVVTDIDDGSNFARFYLDEATGQGVLQGNKGLLITAESAARSITIAPNWEKSYSFNVNRFEAQRTIIANPKGSNPIALAVLPGLGTHGKIVFNSADASSEWASIDATDHRTDYIGRREVWLRAASEDPAGWVQLHGGANAGTPLVLSRATTETRIADVDTGGNWHPVSDRKMKTSIRGIALGLDAVLKMRPVAFQYKEEVKARGEGAPDRLGFVAQEMEEVVPEAVKMNDDGLYTLAPTLLIPVLVKAIQELTRKVEELTDRVHSLEEAI